MHLWWTASSRREVPKEKQKIARNHPDCYTGPKGHFPVDNTYQHVDNIFLYKCFQSPIKSSILYSRFESHSTENKKSTELCSNKIIVQVVFKSELKGYQSPLNSSKTEAEATWEKTRTRHTTGRTVKKTSKVKEDDDLMQTGQIVQSSEKAQQCPGVYVLEENISIKVVILRWHIYSGCFRGEQHQYIQQKTQVQQMR